MVPAGEGYDSSAAPRRWRGLDLDLGTTQVFLQASAYRVACPGHGVVVVAVPWARPGSRFTAAFQDTVGWLVCHAALVGGGGAAAALPTARASGPKLGSRGEGL